MIFDDDQILILIIWIGLAATLWDGVIWRSGDDDLVMMIFDWRRRPSGRPRRGGRVAGRIPGGVPEGRSVLERSRAPFLLILRHPFSDMYFCIDLSSNFLHFDLLFGYLFEGFFILVPSLFPGLLFHVFFKFIFYVSDLFFSCEPSPTRILLQPASV